MPTRSVQGHRTTFRFRELIDHGTLVQREQGAGVHGGEQLELGPLRIPDNQITRAAFDNGQLTIHYLDPEAQPRFARFVVTDDPVPVWQSVNYGLSRRNFAAQLDQAIARNQGHLVRETVCPWCQAKILTLQSGDWSPQVWCEYCDALITTIFVEGLAETERDYRICPQCGMYSRPRKFSEAYFYFLIVHAGVHHVENYCCSGCMRPRVWRMVAGNIPGVLGLPMALAQWVRVYRDSVGRGPLRGLDSANRLLRRNRISRALQRYARILERHPVSAGVLYNVARGLIARGERVSARRTLELAIRNCSNYGPALQQLQQLDAVEFSGPE